jgi:hypothetical protein
MASGYVFKHGVDPEEARWLAEDVACVPQSGFRLATPLMATNGKWIVDGWSAWSWMPGTHHRKDLSASIRAGRAFHLALAHLPRPMWRDKMVDPWTMGDRIAWGEAPLELHPSIMELCAPLMGGLRLEPGEPGVCHCDLAGNTLLQDGMEPGLIDLSLYWRPTEFAVAVAAVDFLDWYGATPAMLIAELGESRQVFELLARAQVYRLATYQGLALGENELKAKLRVHEPGVRWVLKALTA